MNKPYIIIKKNIFSLFITLIVCFFSVYNNYPVLSYSANEYLQKVNGGDDLKHIRKSVYFNEKSFVSVQQDDIRTHNPGPSITHFLILKIWGWNTPYYVLVIYIISAYFLFYVILLTLSLSKTNITKNILFYSPFILYLIKLQLVSITYVMLFDTISCLLVILSLIIVCKRDNNRFYHLTIACVSFSYAFLLRSLTDIMGVTTFLCMSLICFASYFKPIRLLLPWHRIVQLVSILFLSLFTLSFYKIKVNNTPIAFKSAQGHWSRLWKQPDFWWGERYKGNWIDRGGGFIMCDTYSKTCEDIINTENKKSIDFKWLTIKTVIQNPLPFLIKKSLVIIRYWFSNQPILDGLIFLSFLISIYHSFTRRYKRNFLLFIATLVLVLSNILILFFTHIEVRYFILPKTALLFSVLLYLGELLNKRNIIKRDGNPPINSGV